MWVPLATARRTVRSGRVAVDLAAAGDVEPQLGQPVDDGEVRVAGDQRAVERPDAGAEHQVGRDAALQERPQHPDLDRAEDAPAPEHERGGHGHAVHTACSARTRRVARRSAQNDSTGTVPQTRVTNVKGRSQRALRESRNAVTRKIM